MKEQIIKGFIQVAEETKRFLGWKEGNVIYAYFDEVESGEEKHITAFHINRKLIVKCGEQLYIEDKQNASIDFTLCPFRQSYVLQAVEKDKSSPCIRFSYAPLNKSKVLNQNERTKSQLWQQCIKEIEEVKAMPLDYMISYQSDERMTIDFFSEQKETYQEVCQKIGYTYHGKLIDPETRMAVELISYGYEVYQIHSSFYCEEHRSIQCIKYEGDLNNLDPIKNYQYRLEYCNPLVDNKFVLNYYYKKGKEEQLETDRKKLGEEYALCFSIEH